MADNERRAVLKVERGLSTLTYRWDAVFGAGPGAAPVAIVEGASPGIRLVSAPGDEFGVLAQPGRGLVVVADEAGTLEIVVRSSVPGGSLKAELELKRVDGPRSALDTHETLGRPHLPEGGQEFLMRAHVSLRGDVAVYRGNWICGPDMPGRIEGIEISAAGSDLPLEYQVATGGRTGGWSNWFPAGAYAGSRGKALPLIGVRVRLRDGAAPNLALKGDALFLGAAVASATGREIELVGPSPLDPLVGLRLNFVTAGPEMEAPTTELSPARPLSRLRVFRRAVAEAEPA